MQDVISKNTLFRGLKNKHVRLISDIARKRKFRAGERIFDVGSPQEELFLLTSGQVALVKNIISKAGTMQPHIAAVLGAGDFFGEGVFLDSSHHSLNAEAMTNIEAIGVHKDDVLRALQHTPEAFSLILHELAKELSQRLAKETADSAALTVMMQEVNRVGDTRSFAEKLLDSVEIMVPSEESYFLSFVPHTHKYSLEGLRGGDRHGYQAGTTIPVDVCVGDGCAIGDVFSTRSPRLVRQKKVDEFAAQKYFEREHMLTVPLVSGNTFLGTLITTTPKMKDYYGHDDLNSLSLLGHVAAPALHRVQMGELDKQRQNLEFSRKFGS